VPVALVNKFKSQLQAVYDFLLKLYPPPKKVNPIEEVKLAPVPAQNPPVQKEESKNPTALVNPFSMQHMSTFIKKRVNKMESVVSQIRVHIADPKKR
jgi:hypothetical protein